MKSTFFFFFSIICLCFFPGNAALRTKSSKPLPLSSIHLIDRNGFSETISNKDRLAKFQNVPFLDPQPYQKVLRIYIRDSKGNIRSVITTYHENGNPKQLLEVLNGRANGKYFEWNENGTPRLSAKVIGGDPDVTPQAERSWVFDELAQVWDEQNHLVAEIPYSQGMIEGIAIYYHTSGKVWKHIPFKNGMLHGTVEIYQATGPLLYSLAYQNGKREGPSIRYWESGAIAMHEEYDKGKLFSGDYFDQSGQSLAHVCNGSGTRVVFGKEHPVEYQNFVNGILEGEIRVVDGDGVLKRVYHIKEGIKHGEEFEYYPSLKGSDPIPKLAFSWSQGKVQGIARTWYSNGQLESQKEMANNHKHGLLSAWYRDGSLMMMEEYEHQKLVRGDYYKKGMTTPTSHVRRGEGTVIRYDEEGNFLQKIPYKNGQPVL